MNTRCADGSLGRPRKQVKDRGTLGRDGSGDCSQACAASWRHAHGVGPGELGCPWKGGGGRILPKGAAGIQPAKEMHDDDNGMICLGCWSSITEADTETDLCFLINGHKVFLRASAPRNVLFMGYIPHESRPADPSQPATKPRVHHSSFAKPEAEHLAASILSSLPCRGPWRMGDRKLLRTEAQRLPGEVGSDFWLPTCNTCKNPP